MILVKFLLLVVLLFFALGLASAILQRIAALSQRISGLQSDLKRSELKLEKQLQRLQEQQDHSGDEEKLS